MKNLVKHFGTRGRVLCAIVPAAVMIFILAACANGTTEQNPLVISGTLSSVGGSPSIVSRLSVGGPLRAVVPEPEATTQTFRAELGSDNKTLSGKLKDGSITFELSGEYDASTKVFSMQAPSSRMIFSIVGKLNAANTIDKNQTSASVKVKDDTGEWTSIDLTATSSNQIVDDVVNADMTDVTYIPVYCRGILTDQIMALGGYSLKYYVTGNSITMYDGDNPPEDFTVVEVTNADGTKADENGPWHLIIQATWYPMQGQPIPHNEKFYVSKTFTGKIKDDIGSNTVNDLFWGNGGEQGATTLTNAISSLGSGIKMYVAPFCSDDRDKTTFPAGELYPNDNFSPLFTGATATANAKDAGNVLKAKSGFVVALK